MFNALTTLLGAIMGILVAVAKKLVGVAFLLALLAVSSLVTLALILEHIVR